MIPENPIAQGVGIGVTAYGVLMITKPACLYTPGGRLKKKNMSPMTIGLMLAVVWVAFQTLVKGKRLSLGGADDGFASRAYTMPDTFYE